APASKTSQRNGEARRVNDGVCVQVEGIGSGFGHSAASTVFSSGATLDARSDAEAVEVPPVSLGSPISDPKTDASQ
ncbi:MAG: hypothetical protein Q8K87_07415, partial [Hydrogenophaga sp.]|nr:hypothetical protein [Hydrogenophaga sp.]